MLNATKRLSATLRALVLLASLLCASDALAQDLSPEALTHLEARSKAHDKRYGPAFYGIELPETGARVLLIVDASKSMGRKDALRTDGGTRWQTLIDEVETMTQTMADLQAKHPRLSYTLTLLYDVGGTPHKGSAPFDLTQPTARDRLLNELRAKKLGQGGNYEATFCETLWPLVAQQHITHIFFLGDNDIGAYASTIETAFYRWYALTPKEPKEAELKPLWRLKRTWFEPWKKWRAPSARRTLDFRRADALRLMPPPKDVIFSAIVIGQASPLLKAFTEAAHGTYVERKKTKRKKD